MRSALTKSLASLLLVLLSFPLIAPAFLVDAAADLPACCRLHGKHHCMDMGDSSSPAGPALKQTKCPAFPRSAVTPSASKIFLFALQTRTSTTLILHTIASANLSTSPRTELRGATSQRGPPSLP